MEDYSHLTRVCHMIRNGLAIMQSGTKFWYKNGEYHREHAPAFVLTNGYCCWYLNGKVHREDGPAIIYARFSKAWYWHGNKINCSSQEEFERILKLKAFW